MPASAPWGRPLPCSFDQLRAAGCAKIFREKASSAQPTRRKLLRMLKALGPGDLVTVTRIDRMARSTFDLFAIVKQIVDAKAQFRSQAEPWADTGTSTGRLMIAVLGGLADVERDLIRTRTAEGRVWTKAPQPQHRRLPRLEGPRCLPLRRWAGCCVTSVSKSRQTPTPRNEHNRRYVKVALAGAGAGVWSG
jgi:Resolvase, N terminal domain